MTPAAEGVLPRRFVHARDLLFNLVRRQFHARYTDSILGLIWAILSPLTQLLTFYFLFQVVLSLDIRRYSSFAFIGIIAWGWFSATINESVRTLKSSRDIIEQPGFPAPVLPFVSVATNMLDFLIALPIVAIIILIEGHPLHGTLVLLPVIVAIQFAFTLGLAYIVAGLNAAFRDTQHLLVLALRLYFFMTPIFYSLESVPERFLPFFDLNPMAHVVEAYRAILMRGEMPEWVPLALVTLVAGLAVWVGMGVFRWARFRYLEEL